MWEPVSHYRSQLWGGSLRVACAPPGVRTGMSINSGGPLRLPAQPHIGSNTYEATGVKRVSSSSPVLDRGTGAWFRCFLHSNHSMRAVRRSLLITCEPATARTPMRGDQRLMIWLYERDGSIKRTEVVERHVRRGPRP